MSKRPRAADGAAALRDAIECVCGRPAAESELAAAALSPLERQVVRLRASLPGDVVLMVACGYRVKFYGRDSRAASRRLGIMCIPTTPFESSSVPLTRVNLYVHRLVAMGYRVAFADQENASLRAVSGAAKGIFAREVSRIYSRGTLLPSEDIGGAAPSGQQEHTGEADAGEEKDNDNENENDREEREDTLRDSSELFMCFLASGGTSVTLVSFVMGTRVHHRMESASELLDVLHRYDIVEIVVLGEALRAPIADALDGALPLHRGPTRTGEEDTQSVTYTHVPNYPSNRPLNCSHSLDCVRPDVNVSAEDNDDEAIALYLQPFGLDSAYSAIASSSASPLTAAPSLPWLLPSTARMDVPGSTLRALDVFHSSAGPRETLFALLDQCTTAAGSRRLRVLLSAPPCVPAAIRARQAAVERLIAGPLASAVDAMLREAARGGDMEAIIAKLRAQRCTVPEYKQMLRAIAAVHAHAVNLLAQLEASESPTEMASVDPLDCGDRGPLHEVLRLLAGDDIASFVTETRADAASEALTPLDFFASRGFDDAMAPHAAARDAALAALDAELLRIRSVLRLPALEYRTVSGTPFVIDVPRAAAARAPSAWAVLSRTRTHVRLRTPALAEQHVALCAARERLARAAAAEWRALQSAFAAGGAGAALRLAAAAAAAAAEADALRAVAAASAAAGYAAPALVAGRHVALRLAAARHPLLDRRLRGGCVGCDVSAPRGGALVLTGPNMGGKSALMRMLGTLVLMAQVGSRVPAESAQLPVFEAVYTRMGASDAPLENASTFLSEMAETSRILRAPRLSRALVLLDELGRGTSSFDGIAVAAATLEFLVRQEVTTVFVTHYAQICEPYEGRRLQRQKIAASEKQEEKEENEEEAERVACYFMGFREERDETSAEGTERRLVFTYKPMRGVTPSSFGVRVAKMAGLPQRVVEAAQRISESEAQRHTARTALQQIRQFCALKNETT